MAAGAGGAQGEHDAHDRAFFAGLLIVLGLLGASVALVHRHGMPHSSQPGDACPVSARGGLVGYDARTGAVRWTNVVPPGGYLDRDAGSGQVHLVRLAEYVDGRSDRFLTVDRQIDPVTGRIAACSSAIRTIAQTERNQQIMTDPLEPPIQFDGSTVMKWADGIRATDATNTGIWSIPHGQARARIGDALVVTGAGDGRARTRLLDLRTGEEIWSVREKLINVPAKGAPIVTANPTYHRKITGRDLATGRVLWTGQLPPLSRAGESSPAYPAGDLAIIPVGDGSAVAALELATGRIRWRADGGSPGRNRRFSEPGSVDDVVRSADGDTVIVAVSAERPPYDH